MIIQTHNNKHNNTIHTIHIIIMINMMNTSRNNQAHDNHTDKLRSQPPGRDRQQMVSSLFIAQGSFSCVRVISGILSQPSL